MFEKLKMKMARHHDAKKVKKLFTVLAPDKTVSDVENLIADKQILVFKKRKKIKAAVAFVVVNIIGLFTIMYIKKIAVDKNAQGKGVGSFLLQKIKNLTKIKNIYFTFLFSIEKAKKFYQKNKLKNYGRFFWWQ